MDSMSIALGALRAAQAGLDIAGNNIANAATEGYHRQRIEFLPAYSSESNGFLLGGGVNVTDITRMIDSALEKQLTRQCSLSGQAETELNTLSSIEAAFGELGSADGLNAAIDDFFNAMNSLSGDPLAVHLQTQVVRTGESMAVQFRTLGTFLGDLSTSIVQKASVIVDEVNELANQIADLNSQIRDITINGGSANNLKDQRDARINDLAKLVGITTIEREGGSVDISIGGGWLVVDSAVQHVEVALQRSGLLGIAPVGTTVFTTELEGGQLGACFSLNNTSIAAITDNLDRLAQSIISSVNRYHVQGLGESGSFTDLVGTSLTVETLSEIQPPVANGQIYVRVTNSATGEATRTMISVDASSDTLSTMAAKFDAVSGIDARVEMGRLHITSESGYSFDFLPAVISPAPGTLTGTCSPVLSGIYSGSQNDNWTFTIVGTGQVGNSDSLSVQVTDSDGNVLAVLNVGNGYTAGQALDVAEGIKVAFGPGTLNDTDAFTAQMIANSDSSGFLAAAGLNTFFSGTNARDIAVSSFVSDSPSRIAVSLGADLTDNANALRLGQVGSQVNDDLGGLSIRDYYQELVTDIGRDVSLKQLRADNIDTVTQNLKTQREDRSGVDVNDEAAQMLIFERMFQAAARYLNTVQSSMDEVMRLL